MGGSAPRPTVYQPQEAALLSKEMPTWTLPPEAKSYIENLPPLSTFLSGLGEQAVSQVMPQFIRAGMGTAEEPIARELGRTMGPEMMQRALQYQQLPLQALGLGQFVTPRYEWQQYKPMPEVAYPPTGKGVSGGGDIMSGAGALLTALKTVGIISSREFKKDIQPLSNTEYNDILDKVRNLEVVKFRYKYEPETSQIRTGVIAEDAPSDFVTEDKKQIDVVNLLGFLLATVKKQQQMIDKLSQRVGD